VLTTEAAGFAAALEAVERPAVQREVVIGTFSPGAVDAEPGQACAAGSFSVRSRPYLEGYLSLSLLRLVADGADAHEQGTAVIVESSIESIDQVCAGAKPAG
jgi:hypothetical protein